MTELRGTLSVSMLKAARAPFVAVLAAMLAASPSARADERLEFLADQLRNGADFRVRTQAALALGATDDAGAVPLLCEGLDDSNDTVRSASAAGLGKLARREGLDCLRHHANDDSASVKSVVERALKTIEGGGSAAEVAPSAYVAIGPTTDKTGRAGDGVSKLVRSAVEGKLGALGGFALAPEGEAAAAARRVLAKRKLKGFFLQTSVEAPVFDGGTLKVQVRMTMWTYPGKALQGEFSPSVAMPGATQGDAPTEDRLIRMAVERAAENFAQTARANN